MGGCTSIVPLSSFLISKWKDMSNIELGVACIKTNLRSHWGGYIVGYKNNKLKHDRKI